MLLRKLGGDTKNSIKEILIEVVKGALVLFEGIQLLA